MYTKVISIKNNPTTFYLLVTGTVFAALVYIYCVNTAVRNTLSRERSQEAVAELKTDLSDLEYRFLLSENRMTLELATNLGLSEPAEKHFIPGSGSAEKLSLSSN